MTNNNIFFKVTTSYGGSPFAPILPHGGIFQWPLPKDGKPGEWAELKKDEKIVPCFSGLHVLKNLDVVYNDWFSERTFKIFKCEIEGPYVEFENKTVCRKARLLEEVEVRENVKNCYEFMRNHACRGRKIFFDNKEKKESWKIFKTFYEAQKEVIKECTKNNKTLIEMSEEIPITECFLPNVKDHYDFGGKPLSQDLYCRVIEKDFISQFWDMQDKYDCVITSNCDSLKKHANEDAIDFYNCVKEKYDDSRKETPRIFHFAKKCFRIDLLCAALSLLSENQDMINYFHERLNVWESGYGLIGDLNGVMYVYESLF